jgi:hypothetical protein
MKRTKKQNTGNRRKKTENRKQKKTKRKTEKSYLGQPTPARGCAARGPR